MKLVPTFMDYETFWSQTHSLSKMSPMAYVMHPETEIISLAYKFDRDRTHVIFGEDKVKAWVREVDWSDKYLISHNNEGFDSMISAWRLGIDPAMWGCTLAMARPIHAKTTGLSLAKLVEHYGIGVKDATALHNTKGRHLRDFTREEIAAMKEYNKEDTEQCARLFRVLGKQTTARELRLIDMTIRMLVEPQFEVDRPLLVGTLAAEKAQKAAALVKLQEDMQADSADDVQEMLASGPKFAEFLRSRGVEPPMKPSPANPEKQTFALAKTDQGFLDLQEHDDPIVAAAAATRLGVKSTILETRVESFITASDALGGLLPVPLKNAGADTTGRWSGWAYNPQNLPRINTNYPKLSDALRYSLRAPKGYKVVVADLSGIELRVNMFLWKVPYAMKLFQDCPDKADLYKYFASKELYNVPEEGVSKGQRQVGKVSHLGLGFGAGAPTFQKVAKIMGGINMPLDPDEDRPDQISATEVVKAYRAGHPEIVKGWRKAHDSLVYMQFDGITDIDPWGLCQAVNGGIKTPQGMIRYPDLREIFDEEAGRVEWWYGQGRNKTRIYAGKVVENMVQHLAREVMADNCLTIKQQTGYSPALLVHDERVGIAPESEADDVLAEVQKVMRTPPKWWPELITWSEGDVADSYGAAK
jgi:DNA polymerase